MLRTAEFGSDSAPARSSSSAAAPLVRTKRKVATKGGQAAMELVEFFKATHKNRRAMETALEKLGNRMKNLKGRSRTSLQKFFDIEYAKREKKALEAMIEKAKEDQPDAPPEVIEESFKEDKKFVNELINDLLKGDPVSKRMVAGARIGANFFNAADKGEPTETGEGLAEARALAQRTVADALSKSFDAFAKELKLPKPVITATKKTAKKVAAAKTGAQRTRAIKSFGEAVVIASVAKLSGIAAKKLTKAMVTAAKKLAKKLIEVLPDPMEMLKGLLNLAKRAANTLMDYIMGKTPMQALLAQLPDVPTDEPKRPPKPPSGGAAVRAMADALGSIPTIGEIQARQAQPEEQFAAQAAAIQAGGPDATQVLATAQLARISSDQEAAREAGVASERLAANISEGIENAARPSIEIKQQSIPAESSVEEPVQPIRTFAQKVGDAALTGAVGALTAAGTAALGYQAKRAYNYVRGRRVAEDADLDADVLDTGRIAGDDGDGPDGGWRERARQRAEAWRDSLLDDALRPVERLSAPVGEALRERHDEVAGPGPERVTPEAAQTVQDDEAAGVGTFHDVAEEIRRRRAERATRDPGFEARKRRIFAAEDLSQLDQRQRMTGLQRRFDTLARGTPEIPPGIVEERRGQFEPPLALAAEDTDRDDATVTTDALSAADAPEEGTGLGLRALHQTAQFIAPDHKSPERAYLAQLVRAMSNGGLLDPELQAMNLSGMIAHGIPANLDHPDAAKALPGILSLVGAQAEHHWPQFIRDAPKSHPFKAALIADRKKRLAADRPIEQGGEGLATFNEMQNKLHKKLDPTWIPPGATQALPTARGADAITRLTRQVVLGGYGSPAQSFAVLAARKLHEQGDISRADLDEFTRWVMHL